MKQLFTLLIVIAFGMPHLHAADHTIGTAGNSYSPADITVQLGDNVTIQASTTHPTTQVSEATWNANGTTAVAGGFGTRSAEFTITINSLNTIYFVCNNHIAQGMKGQINVSAATGIEEYVNKIGFELLGNPVRDVLRYRAAELPPGAVIAIYDLEGSQLDARLLDGGGEIKLDLPTGQYLYVIRNKHAELLATGQLIMVE